MSDHWEPTADKPPVFDSIEPQTPAPSLPIELTLMRDIELNQRNAIGVLVAYEGIEVMVQVPTNAAIINRDGMIALQEAAITFVRDTAAMKGSDL